MSIIDDYAAIAKQVKGDDWWTAAPKEPAPAYSIAVVRQKPEPEIPEGWGTMSGIGSAMSAGLLPLAEELKRLQAEVERVFSPSTDWRYCARIANIEVSAAGAAPDIFNDLQFVSDHQPEETPREFVFRTSLPPLSWRQINAVRPSDRISHGSCPTGKFPHGK